MTVERYFEMNDCTLVDVSHTVKPFTFVNFNSVLVDGGTYTNSNTSTNQFTFTVTGSYGISKIVNTTINAKFGINCVSHARRVATFMADSNTLLSPDTWQGIGIQIDDTTVGGASTVFGSVVTYNAINNYEFGIFNYGAESDITGNSLYCNNPILLWGGQKNVVLNNTMKSLDATAQGGDGGRCLVLGRKWFADYVQVSTAAADFTATTFTSSVAWDLSNVPTDGTAWAVVTSVNTGSPAVLFFGVINAADDGTDTVTVDQWIRVSDYATGIIPTGDDNYVTVNSWSSDNYIVNNIMDGIDSLNTLTFDFNPLEGKNIVDYNCYQAGSASLSNLGSDDLDTLAELQAKWVAWPEDSASWYLSTSKTSDTNSIEADPLFIDPDNYDLRLRPESPALNDGKEGSMGGWQPFALANQEYRARYAGNPLYR
jgi:hypothetical protein